MAKSLSARQLHILAILEASEDELSGQALHVLLKDKQLPMGLATVYRNLRVLQQKGEVRCRHLPSERRSMPRWSAMCTT